MESSPKAAWAAPLVIAILSSTTIPTYADTDYGLSLRLPQSLETSANTITVIDRATIEMMGALSISDALRLVPGILVGHRNAGSESVAYQGISDEYPRRTQVLINGRSTFLPTSGGVSWASLPVQIDDVDRIEVIHGPNAAISGSNSMLGTINIITRSARESEAAQIKMTQGTNGERYLSGRANAVSDAFAISLSAHDNRDTNGYDSKNDQTPFTDTYKTHGGILRIDSDLNRLAAGAGEASLEIGVSRADVHLAGYIDPWAFQPGQSEAPFTTTTEQNYQNLAWTSEYDGYRASARASRMEDTNKEMRSLNVPSLGSIPADNGYSGTRYDLDVDIGKELGETLQWVVGLALRRDEITSEALLGYNSPQVVNTTRGFAQIDWKPTQDWTLSAMLAAESYSLTDSILAPTLAANYHFAADHYLRIGYSEGYRQPMAYEVHGDKSVPISGYGAIQYVMASGEIKPELNKTIDLNWTYRPDKALRTNVRVYSSTLTDLITPYLRPYDGLTFLSGHVLDFKNAGEATASGIETSLTWTTASWMIRGAYTLSKIQNDQQCSPIADVDLCSSLEQGQPTHNFSLLVGKKMDNGWSASMTYQYISDYKWMWVTYPNISSNNYLDARVAKKFEIGSSEIEASLMGTNLLGRVHDFRTDASWDPAVYLQLSMSYF